MNILPPQKFIFTIMRLIIFLMFLLFPAFLCTQAQAQQHLRKMPDKDPVMVIDKLMPGKSKHYNWHSGSLKCTIRNNDKDCKKINVTFNNKPLLLHYCLAKEKSFNLKLLKKLNIIVLTADRGNTIDSTFATVTLAGEPLSYTVKALCRKNINDTIFIRH
jgi:hypothetical protein